VLRLVVFVSFCAARIRLDIFILSASDFTFVNLVGAHARFVVAAALG